jgi:hypothetical protein
MIFGATTAAVGSALAGFLGTEGRRKSAALVGALGAVLTVLPKALPDKTEFEAKLAAADKHHTVGVKFRNQFVFAKATESLTNAQKYVSARFTDCAALNPPSGVPDLPARDMDVSEATLSNFNGTDQTRLVVVPSATGAHSEMVPVRSPVPEAPPRKHPSSFTAIDMH